MNIEVVLYVETFVLFPRTRVFPPGMVRINRQTQKMDTVVSEVIPMDKRSRVKVQIHMSPVTLTSVTKYYVMFIPLTY